MYTLANVCKLYIGICMQAVPQGFTQAGLYGALLGLAYILAVNMFTTYLLLKARNKFKREHISNLSELAFLLYGERARAATDVLILATQFSFLVAYNIYFGQQFDQLACKTLMIAECGHASAYRVMFDLLLVPVLLQKQMRSIAYFSIFALTATLFALAMTVALEVEIYSNPTSYARDVMGIKLEDKDLEYKYFDAT